MLIQKVLFTQDECKKIIDFKNKYPLLGDNGRWDQFDDFRYKFYTINEKLDVDWIINRLCDFFETEKKLKIYTRPVKLSLHHYTIGDEFGKHIDTGEPIKEWNIGIILNDDFEGGDYVLYDEEDKPVVINKITGNVSIYQSQVPHQVTPITLGERWAIAMFVHKFRMGKKSIM